MAEIKQRTSFRRIFKDKRGNMTAFIIFLLFLLNLITILAIVVLYLRQNKLIKLEQTQKSTLKEIDDTLSAYLLEMKEENEQLLIKIAGKTAKQRELVSEGNQEKGSSHQKYENDDKANNKPLNRVKQKAVAAYKAPLEQTDALPDLMMINQDKLELTSDNPIESTTIKKAQKQNDFKETLHGQLSNSAKHKSKTVSDEVMEFYQNGYSIEEIAKKLSKGKTEVELIVKLNKKKEK
jgi:hypothetical protein